MTFKGLPVLALVGSLALIGADWSSCQDDLDRLRRRASDASDKASEVESASSDLQSKKDEYEQCRSYPRIYDIYRDRCRSLADEYETARSNFESEKSDLESALDDVDSALRSVSGSCGFAFSAGSRATTGQPGGDSLCRLLQRYKGRMPLEKLMETCTKAGLTVEQCRVCLQ
jgi:DNA repair exonuclease SbcCD ATPase subunit